jgi:hypothetical protein
MTKLPYVFTDDDFSKMQKDMTPKIVTFGSLEIWDEFKMSHKGNIWVKTSLSTNPSIDSHNARSKDDPKVKIYVQPTNGVIVQS